MSAFTEALKFIVNFVRFNVTHPTHSAHAQAFSTPPAYRLPH